MSNPATSVAFFGPAGTFTEEALLTQEDYAAAVLVPKTLIAEVLEAVQNGQVDIGFVPIENAIEGTVNATLDALVFDFDLFIQREVVLDVHLHLMAPHGTKLDEVRRVLSFPVALAQCRHYLASELPGAETIAANSTADAARLLGEHPEPGTAAIAPRLAAELYGLSILGEDIEDHSDNQTRFVAVAPSSITAPTGHDRTSIVCYQDADRPGNLHGILGQFAARNINLTKLESRPTRWWPTAYETSTPSLAGSSSWAHTRPPGPARQPGVSRQIEPGRRPTCGSPACDQRSGELPTAPNGSGTSRRRYNFAG